MSPVACPGPRYPQRKLGVAARATPRLAPAVVGTAAACSAPATRPFDWTFTRNDLNQVLAKIADREPDLRLAA